MRPSELTARFGFENVAFGPAVFMPMLLLKPLAKFATVLAHDHDPWISTSATRARPIAWTAS